MRPVVVNSLLCFLKNYREQANILQIIDQHFTLESRRVAYQILLELLSETDKLAVASSSCTPSLIDLFDRVNQSDTPLPIFATDDLTVLPLCLNYEDGLEQPKDLYNEVRQLRLYVHNALGQKAYNSPQWKRNNGSFDFNFPASTPPNSNFSCIKSTNIRPATPSKNLQTKQPSIHADRCDFNVSSLLKNDCQRSALQCSPTSSSSSTSSEINPVKSGQQKRLVKSRKHTGNRLDKAVQKLTDRLLKTETNNNEDCNFDSNMHEEKFEDDMAVRENNNNTIASFGSSAAAITAQILQNFASQNYENNRLAGQTDSLNEEQSNEMPLDDQLDTDQELNNEFGMPEHEKSSSQGSPTPSDMSMNRDGIDSANNSEKPYVCSKFNCRKRFSNKFLLKKHEFIHSGLRPHVCPFCNKPFNRKDNLLRHKKTHLNNALAQMNGRRRHNALRGVSEEAADFQLFRQQMNITEEPQNSVANFSFLDTNLEETN